MAFAVLNWRSAEAKKGEIVETIKLVQSSYEAYQIFDGIGKQSQRERALAEDGRERFWDGNSNPQNFMNFLKYDAHRESSETRNARADLASCDQALRMVSERQLNGTIYSSIVAAILLVWGIVLHLRKRGPLRAIEIQNP